MKEAYKLCEKALYEMIIGEAGELLQDEIKTTVELIEDYSIWKHKVMSLLTLLPSENSTLKDWGQTIILILNELIQSGAITLRSDLNFAKIIKIKTKVRTKKNRSSIAHSTAFLDKPLYEYFEKKSKQDITVSSVHGVKGETYEAVLLKIDRIKGPTLTPDKLFTGELDDEMLRIAYVAMTRPRKILAIAVPYKKIMI